MFSKRSKIVGLAMIILHALMAIPVWAQDAAQYHKTTGAPQLAHDVAQEMLITNINIFGGTSEKLIVGKNVVLNGNKCPHTCRSWCYRAGVFYVPGVEVLEQLKSVLASNPTRSAMLKLNAGTRPASSDTFVC